jgi:hypothetical protein
LDAARNLIDTDVLTRAGILIVNFVRQIQTDDTVNDVNLGENFCLVSVELQVAEWPNVERLLKC